ncbi:odorant receptor 10-like [Megachile rotundata]|uniref:odorant receptor 10-like n=1 Tax=Megachile rotundata TaxID=143995 RepID=UPI003FCFE11D
MIGFFKIAVLSAHKKNFYDLVVSIERSFIRPSDDITEQKILMECKSVCDMFIVFITFCVQGTCSGYAVTPLLENIGKPEMERMLPFNLWIDFPTGKSPYFEVLFAIQMLCVYHVAISYFCFDNFLCLVCLNITGQFRILQHRLASLNGMKKTDDEDSDAYVSDDAIKYRTKLKSCIRHHQTLINYCRKLENVFTLIVLGEVLFLAMLLCCLGFQIFLMSSPPARRISLVIGMMGICSQLFMFSYCWDGLVRESVNVGQAAFAGPWSIFSIKEGGKSLRSDVLIIIMRSNKACCLTAAGFFPVSLETCTAVLSTAMSYFTLLRHSAPDLQTA